MSALNLEVSLKFTYFLRSEILYPLASREATLTLSS